MAKTIKRVDFYAVIGLFLLTFVLLSPYLLTWPTPYIFPTSGLGTDLTREVLPPAHYIVDTFRQTGELPLWRTYLLSGAPLIGHPVIPVLYPPHWLAAVLPLALALNIDALLHLWLLAIGMYACLRLVSGLQWQASFIGALMFAHIPLFMAHISGGHWSTLATMAWLPTMWLAVHQYWKATTRISRMGWAVLLGVGLASQILNDGKYFAICAICLGVSTLSYIRPNPVRWVRDNIILWGVGCLVMFGLAAGQLLPFIEFFPQTNRTALTYLEAASNDVPFAVLGLGVFFPFKLQIAELFFFPGVGVLTLTIYGVFRGWVSRVRWWILAIVVVLLVSGGSNAPLYWFLYEFVPGFKGFRAPERWWLIGLFGMVILAAWGIQKWLDNSQSIVAALRRARWLILSLIVLNALYLASAVLQLVAPVPFQVFPHALIVPVISLLLLFVKPSQMARYRTIFAVVLCALVLVDLWSEDFRIVYPQSVADYETPDQVTTFLQSSIQQGERVFLPYGGLSETTLEKEGIETADGWDPTQLATYTSYMQRASGCNSPGYSVGAPPTRGSADALRDCPTFTPDLALLKLLNVRYIVLPQKIPDALTDPKVVYKDSQYRIYDIGAASGTAFGVGQGIDLPANAAASDSCLNQLAQSDVTKTALIEGSTITASGSTGPTVTKRETVANGAVYTVQADTPGWLVRSETWASGWHAVIDGKEAPVYRADCVLQSVWVDSGQHVIRFEYAPSEYLIGRWISLGSVILLVVGSVVTGLYVMNKARNGNRA